MQVQKLKYPKNWFNYPFNNLIKLVGGKQPARSSFIFKPKKGYVRLLQIRDFENDTNTCYVKINKNLSLCDESDILIARYGASLGRILRGKSGVHNVATIKTVFDKKKINPDYFFYWLNSHLFQSHVKKIGDRVAQAGFNKADFNLLKIPLPNILEQQKISSILSTVDELILYYDIVIEKTNDLKKGLMQQLLTKGIGHTKFKKIKWYFGKEIKIPDTWNVQKLKDICIKIVDGPHVSPKYTKSGIPFITVNNVLGGVIDLTNAKYISHEDHLIYSKRAKPEKGDVLYTKGGTTGFAKEIDVDFEFDIWVHLALLKLKKNIVFSKYLEFFLNSELGKNQAKFHTYGVGNQDLVLGRMGKIFVLVPPLLEQKQLASILSEVDSKIDEIDQIRSYLQYLKKGLMQKLLTGQIRVKV